MELVLKDTLVQLGCEEKECKLFMACFRNGPASIAQLAKLSKLQRSTAYIIADQLVTKQLFTVQQIDTKKQLVALPPHQLFRKLDAKYRRTGRSRLALQSSLTDLETIYASPQNKPIVKTFNGSAGLVSIWREILAAKSEIKLWTNQETERNIFDSHLHRQFIDERVKKQIPIRVLAVANPSGLELINTDTQNLRQTKILKTGSIFTAETYIFDDTIVVIDYHTDIFGIMIKNPLIEQSFAAQFELAWSSLSEQDYTR